MINIAKGWLNVAKDQFGLLDEETKKMAEERFEICKTCPIRHGGVCSTKRCVDKICGCGCPLVAKTKVEDEHCPLKKW